MNTPLDDVEFLAASENRIRVLSYLQRTAADRQELRERTGISRPTLSRCLSGLQDRGWITQTGGRCEITPLGSLFIDEFTDLVRTAETIRKLHGLDTSLPIEEMGVDPRRFEDAHVAVVTADDPTAPMHRAKELIRRAGHVRMLTRLVAGPLVEVVWDRTVHGDLTAVVVIPDAVIERIRANAELARMVREALRTDQMTLYRTAEEVSHIVALVDDVHGCLLVQDDDGVVRAELDTDEASFRSWIESTIDAHCRTAEPVSADAFTD